MTLPHHDLEYFRLQLDAKRIELSGPHNAEGIAFEPTADSMDETVLANERDLIVDRLNREASVFRQVAAALDRIAAGEFGICLECGRVNPEEAACGLAVGSSLFAKKPPIVNQRSRRRLAGTPPY